MTPPLPVRRRTVLGAAAALPAAGLLAACTGGADEPAAAGGEPARVRVNTGLGLFQGREAYLTVAEQLGFFGEEGIELDVLPGEGTEFNLTQLAAGQVDIATIDINAAMIEFAKGTFTEFVLACVLHASHLGCVMVPESSGIARPRDLAGTLMAVIPGGTNTLLFPAFADLAGFDADTVEFVSPPPPDFGVLLQAGEVDAIQQFVVARGSIERDLGEPAVVFPYAEWMPELYGSGLGCSRRLAADNPDLVRRFCRAALRGLEYAMANPDEAGRLFATHERHQGGQPEPAAAGENRLLQPYVHADEGFQLGQFDEVRLVQSVALLQAIGVIENSVTPTDIVDLNLAS
jgi:NitT/TauT family transport system substrate-binding protein